MRRSFIEPFGLLCCAAALLAACGGPGTNATPNSSLLTAVRSSAAGATAKPTPGTLVADPKALRFSTAATQTFTAQESNYRGTLTASSSKAAVATVSPSSATGPKATYKVTPVGGGRTEITVKDAAGKSVAVAVSVDNAVIIVNGAHPNHP
jgi:hypothetical protein